MRACRKILDARVGPLVAEQSQLNEQLYSQLCYMHMYMLDVHVHLHVHVHVVHMHVHAHVKMREKSRRRGAKIIYKNVI